MPLPVITVAQMREWEKATWASGQTELAVMRQAGAAVARRAEQLSRPGDFILVLAGKGHNGDDAGFAAEQINAREVQLVRVSEPEMAAKEVGPLLEREPALIIDGLFGIGLNRPLATGWLKFIQQLNQSGVPILSVDVPSGINADTGEPLEDAIRATVTLTLGAVKQGLVQATGWPFTGRLEVASDIGLIPYPFTTEVNWTTQEDFVGYPKPRPVAGHKGTFGHAVIVAGSIGYHGASVLAARGAQRAQPGLISLYTAENVYAAVAAQLQAVMVHPWKAPLVLPESCTAILVGPGLHAPAVPEFIRETISGWWQNSRTPMVADASALSWLREGPTPQMSLRVVTPHPGEAGRMLASSVARVLSERIPSLREISRRWGNCHVVLKSHQTLIGRGKEEVFVNSSGNPGLAQGGSGDLLAGFITGLVAQPALRDDPGKILRYAVWQHGAAADLLGSTRAGWTVENLAEALGSIRPRRAA